MYPYVHGPFAEDTGPGFAYSHYQLPATISTHTGNPSPSLIRSIPVYPARMKLSPYSTGFRLLLSPDPLDPYCIADLSSLTMIAIPCVYCVT